MQIEQRPTTDLKPHPANYRRHPEAQLAVLRDSIRVHGLQKPVVIQSDGTILAGHGLVEAAKLEGLEQVPVHVYDGPYPDAFLAMDNRSALLAEDDEKALSDLLTELQGRGTLEASGYGDGDLEGLLGALSQPGPGEWDAAVGGLPTGDKAPFQQMTFTLHDDQAERVREAVAQAKGVGPFADSPNENSNGNALDRICTAYLNGAV